MESVPTTPPAQSSVLVGRHLNCTKAWVKTSSPNFRFTGIFLRPQSVQCLYTGLSCNEAAAKLGQLEVKVASI